MAGDFAVWERRTRIWAFALALVTLAASALIAMALVRSGQPWGIAVVVALAPALGVYVWRTAPIRRRGAILRAPFPAEWEAVLQREVVFYRALEPDERARFRRQLQVFIGEKRITGIKVRLDDTTRVLAAAANSGRLAAAFTSATHSGDGASDVISQEAATSCTQVPMLESTLAIQIVRKTGWRSGAQVAARAGIGYSSAGAGGAGRSSATARSSPPRTT
jgi:hypothetical protein